MYGKTSLSIVTVWMWSFFFPFGLELPFWETTPTLSLLQGNFIPARWNDDCCWLLVGGGGLSALASSMTAQRNREEKKNFFLHIFTCFLSFPI